MIPRYLWAAMALIGLLTALSVRADQSGSGSSPTTASTAASATLAPSPAPAPDCEYVPDGPVDGSDAGFDQATETKAHELGAPGCRRQCVARVYCASEHPEDKGSLAQVPLATKISKGKMINCDANPTARPSIVSCPLPDDCNQQAKSESFRLAKIVPATAQSDEVLQKLEERKKNAPNAPPLRDYRYGWRYDEKKALTEVPLLTFPADNGDAKNSCHVCASTIAVAEQMWRYALCPAPKDGKTCYIANHCAALRDPTEYSIHTAMAKDIQRVIPASGVSGKGSPAGGGQP